MPRGLPFVLIVLALLLVALPGVLSLIGSPYIARLWQLVMLTVVLTCALNLLTGTAGLLALDTVVYYGFGAYMAGILSTRYEISFIFELLITIVAAGAIGMFIGLALVRLKSIFFAVATVGLAISFFTAVLNWSDLTRGAMGIPNISPISIAGIELDGWVGTYFACAALSILAVVITHSLSHSFYGNALRAIREDEDAARSMGLRPRLIKAQVYAVHAAMMAAAGVYYAHLNSFIGPDNFALLESALILTAIVVGGLGSIPGAILGAMLVVLAPEILREFGHMRMLIFGIILFLSILFLPRGIFSEVKSLAWARRLFPNSPWAQRNLKP